MIQTIFLVCIAIIFLLSIKSFIEGYYGTNNKINIKKLSTQNIDKKIEYSQDYENNKLNELISNSVISNRLILAGLEIKSIYYCILIGLLLVTPFFWLMYNNPNWFILCEQIQSSISIPKNPRSFENYINILSISRGACIFILFGSVISSLSNLSLHLINNNKNLTLNEQSTLRYSNNKKSNVFPVLFSIIFVMVITLLIISYKIEPNKNKIQNNIYNNTPYNPNSK